MNSNLLEAAERHWQQSRAVQFSLEQPPACQPDQMALTNSCSVTHDCSNNAKGDTAGKVHAGYTKLEHHIILLSLIMSQFCLLPVFLLHIFQLHEPYFAGLLGNYICSNLLV